MYSGETPSNLATLESVLIRRVASFIRGRFIIGMGYHLINNSRGGLIPGVQIRLYNNSPHHYYYSISYNPLTEVGLGNMKPGLLKCSELKILG